MKYDIIYDLVPWLWYNFYVIYHIILDKIYDIIYDMTFKE